MLDERKMRILQAITDDYILTAEPVGSRTVARRYDLGVSPATIRNEMADLEELGYLQQPHTSSGRIPSDKGYRYYVDTLMQPTPPGEEELEQIRALHRRRMALEELVQRSARVLALLSRYTAVVMAPRLSKSAVHHVQLLSLDPHHVLMVLVVKPGFVLNRIVDLSEPVTSEDVARLSAFLNEKLRGMSVGDLGPTVLQELREELPDRAMAQAAIELLDDALHDNREDAVYLDGTVNMLNQPEFRDVEKAKNLLAFLDQREGLCEVVAENTPSSGVRVTIGAEHSHEEMHACSMVLASYRIGSEVVGSVGVMGPTRMEYSRVVTLVDLMATSLSEILTGLMKQ